MSQESRIKISKSLDIDTFHFILAYIKEHHPEIDIKCLSFRVC